jgi:hypothetical protein
MRLFNFIQLRNTGSTCQHCVYFKNDPAFIEAAYPGLTVMSSGFASVRDKDGLCSFNQIYLSAGDSCVHYEPCIVEKNPE